MFNGAFGEVVHSYNDEQEPEQQQQKQEEETKEAVKQEASQAATAKRAAQEFACAADGTCQPLTQNLTVIFLNVRDAINRAAVKTRLPPLPLASPAICPRVAALAIAVLQHAKTANAAKWLTPDISPAKMALQLAQAPNFALATFDEIGGFQRPVPLVDPRLTTVSEPLTRPAPALAEGTVAPLAPQMATVLSPTKTFWTTRNKILVAAGVVAVAGVVYVWSRKRR